MLIIVFHWRLHSRADVINCWNFNKIFFWLAVVFLFENSKNFNQRTIFSFDEEAKIRLRLFCTNTSGELIRSVRVSISFYRNFGSTASLTNPTMLFFNSMNQLLDLVFSLVNIEKKYWRTKSKMMMISLCDCAVNKRGRSNRFTHVHRSENLKVKEIKYSTAFAHVRLLSFAFLVCLYVSNLRAKFGFAVHSFPPGANKLILHVKTFKCTLTILTLIPALGESSFRARIYLLPMFFFCSCSRTFCIC